MARFLQQFFIISLGAEQLLSINEDAAPGSLVGHVMSAFDRDENAEIFYYILSEDGNREHRSFSIQKNQIFTQTKLDREEKSR